MVYHTNKPFEYSAEWYATDYHKRERPEDRKDPGPGMYADRDRACLDAMAVDADDRILVAGCGGCHNISLLQSEYGVMDITAFDWSETVLEFARDAFPSVCFLRLDVASMAYREEFDHVVAFDFTEHLSKKDYHGFILSSLKALRPGGRLGIVPGLTVRPEHINLLRPGEIANHLAAAGFGVISLSQFHVVGKKPCG